MRDSSKYFLIILGCGAVAIYGFDMPRIPVAVVSMVAYGFMSLAVMLEEINGKLQIIIDNQNKKIELDDDDY